MTLVRVTRTHRTSKVKAFHPKTNIMTTKVILFLNFLVLSEYLDKMDNEYTESDWLLANDEKTSKNTNETQILITKIDMLYQKIKIQIRNLIIISQNGSQGMVH